MSDTTDKAGEPPRLTLKERARQMRKEAYQKAKLRDKARRLEPQNVQAAAAQKQRLKERRQQLYQQSKDAHKRRQTELQAQAQTEADAQDLAARAQRDEALLKTLVTADQVQPPAQPRLRLVKPADEPAT